MSAIDNITNNSNTVEKDVGDQSTSKMPTKDSTTTTTTTNDSKIHRGSDPMDDTKMPAASDVTRSTSDFVVKPPIYVKGIPVADNIKNRLLIQEIDREAKLQEKIEKTHVVDKFFPYPPPVLGESHGQKRPPYSQDKTAHQKQHQAELHQWHKVQKQHQRRMNEEHKQNHGIHEAKRVEQRTQRATPSQEVYRWKEKTHTRKWGSKRKHLRDVTEKT